MNNMDELRRLLTGPNLGEKPSGLLVEVAVECNANASQVLHAAQEVWSIVLKQSEPGGLNLEEWRRILPSWFVEKCGPEIGMDEALRRRALPIEERMRFAETWSLGAWVHWLKPSERHWAWWNAEIRSPQSLCVQVVVSGFPFPTGSLQWLLKCCGAKAAEVLD